MDKEHPISPWPEWKIVEKIGEGSFGKVYKAQRCERGKTFYSAIKVINIPGSQGELNSVRSETGDDLSAREYFQNLVEECIQEVSTMEYFRGNSHIVSVEDFTVMEYLDDIGWVISIRMEYLTSFMDYCAEKQLTEKEVIQIGLDLSKALEYCRKLKIIHRDVKPENIFVSRFGDFKLGDFGIARELERTMSGFSKKGTYSYMAPEMYRGEQYDSRVDIYSLGIVLYKLMNRNRLPFLNLEKQFITYRDKENALTRRMSGEKLKKPVDAGEEFSRIILKACAYNPDERYQKPEDFYQDLDDLKHGRVKAAETADAAGQKPVSAANAVSGAAAVSAASAEKMQKPSGEAHKNLSQNAEVHKNPMQNAGVHKSSPQNAEAYKDASQNAGVYKSSSQNAGVHTNPPQNADMHKNSSQNTSGSKFLQRSGDADKLSQRNAETKKVLPRSTETGRELLPKLDAQKNSERGTEIDKEAAREAQVRRALAQKKRKKQKNISNGAMLIALLCLVMMMGFAVYIKVKVDEMQVPPEENLVNILQDKRYDTGKHVQKDFAAQVDTIKDRATTIVDNLQFYDWIGVEGDKISYYDHDTGKYMKVLVYPARSEDDVYEEYYYWNEKLFFAYIWYDTTAELYYYDDNGELIRWIDAQGVCHDNETDNEEYVKRGEKYWKKSVDELG